MQLRPWQHGCALILVSGAALAAPSSDTYTVIMSGLPKGEMTVTADGAERQVHYQFQDRGRGPELTVVRREDAQRMTQSLTVSGVDYRKMAVNERFAVKDGRAQWTSEADQGSSATPGFYLPNDGTPEDSAALARALLASRKHELSLLPAGRASIEKVGEREVACGSSGNAKAILYFIRGVDLEPQSLWLTGDGRLFAQGGAWLGVIRKGCEEAQESLIAAQRNALREAARTSAASLRRKPTGPLVIRNATVFDAERRTLVPHSTVVVRGERIDSVGSDGEVAVPQGAEVLDAHGNVLLPGLWDMHVHLQGQIDGLLNLMAGITTVRDMGNGKEELKQLSDSFEQGVLNGPHVIKAGIIDGPGPFAGPTPVLVDTPEALRAAVKDYADSGYVQIKLYSSLKPELVPVAVEAAHARKLRVSGHIPATMTMREAVESGYDEVQHANFWFLNFMGPEVQAKTNTPARFMEVAKHGRELDLASPQVRDFVALLKARGTVLDPTLVVFEGMFIGEKGKAIPALAPWEARLPPTVSRGGRGGGRATTPEEKATYAESYLRMKQMLKVLYEAGVPIVPGTDGTALDYSRELELYVESGVPNAEVLYMATLGSARVMKLDADTGSIAPGKRADLVLIDGDPLKRMADVRGTRIVIKSGWIYEARALSMAAGLSDP